MTVNNIKSIKTEELKPGMVLALPMGRTATIFSVKVGREFVNLITEHGKTRVFIGDEILVVLL